MELKSGQIIESNARNATFLCHYGIVVNTGINVYVLHNEPQRGVIQEKLCDWEMNRSIKSVFDTDLVGMSNKEIMSRFEAFEGQSYNLITNNCEHFVNKMLGVPAASAQFGKGIIFTLFALFLYRKNN